MVCHPKECLNNSRHTKAIEALLSHKIGVFIHKNISFSSIRTSPEIMSLLHRAKDILPKKKKTLRQDENCVRNKNYRNIRSALRIPSVRGYGGCAFDGDVCRRHPVVRHGDGVVLRFSYESVFVYPITKKNSPVSRRSRDRARRRPTQCQQSAP